MADSTSAADSDDAKLDMILKQGGATLLQLRQNASHFEDFVSCFQVEGKISKVLVEKLFIAMCKTQAPGEALNLIQKIETNLPPAFESTEPFLVMCVMLRWIGLSPPEIKSPALEISRKLKTHKVHGLLEYEFIPSIVNDFDKKAESLQGKLIITKARTNLRCVQLLGKCNDEAQGDVSIFLDVNHESCKIIEDAKIITSNLDSFSPLTTCNVDDKTPTVEPLEIKTTAIKNTWALPAGQWQLITFNHAKAVCRWRWQPSAQSEAAPPEVIATQSVPAKYVQLMQRNKIGHNVLSIQDAGNLPKTIQSQLQEKYSSCLPPQFVENWITYTSEDGAAQWRSQREQRPRKFGRH